MSNLTSEEEQKDRDDIKKYGKLIRHGCIDKRETREEAIARTEHEVKVNLRKLREIKNG